MVKNNSITEVYQLNLGIFFFEFAEKWEEGTDRVIRIADLKKWKNELFPINDVCWDSEDIWKWLEVCAPIAEALSMFLTLVLVIQ